MKQGIQPPMAQGRSTKIIWMIKWIRTSRLSIKNSLSAAESESDHSLVLQVARLSTRKYWGTLEEEFFTDNLLVHMHFIIVMIRWTNLAP